MANPFKVGDKVRRVNDSTTPETYGYEGDIKTVKATYRDFGIGFLPYTTGNDSHVENWELVVEEEKKKEDTVFEVGKKYVSNQTQQKFVCVGFDIDANALFQLFPKQNHNLKIFRAGGITGDLIEYVEPRSDTGWVNVFVLSDGTIELGLPWNSREEADESALLGDIGDKRIACVEVKWAEGDGLNDEIV